ncbi:MAG TPA: glycosyltransferase family 9 protein [Lacunisphaera sp.]|jgi:heptosyltransferase-2/heptosyltransferase-3
MIAQPRSTGKLTPLVLRFGAMGDMVLLIPMLKALQQRYGNSCDLVSSGPWTPPLMQRVPACGSLKLLTSRRAPYLLNRSQQQLVRWLRTRPAGPVYVFEPDDKTHWLLQRGGVRPEWICSLRTLPRLPNENILQHALRLASQTPAALRNDAKIPPSPDPAPNARPDLTAADRQDCADWVAHLKIAGSPLVLVQPGNKKTMRRGRRQRATNVKYWPEAAWAKVIRSVRETLPASRVLICGSAQEYDLAATIQQQAGGDGVVNVCGDLPIPRLLALQAIAHSMISVDTGPAHCAAAMGCPLVVMFARIDPALYAPTPTSAPVRLVVPPGNISDTPMTAITPETVISAWHELVAS